MLEWIAALERRRLLSSVLLSEIEANPPGTSDNRYEYVELAGTPGASLTNDYFVAFDGASGTIGVADMVVNLTGALLGSSGLLVIQNSASAGHAVPAGTTLVSDLSFFTQSGGFVNGSLSFYLFNSPSAPFVAGTRYDSGAGTLNQLPAGATALDSVAIPDTNNKSDIVYGPASVSELASLNKGTADAVTRFPGNTTYTSAAWYGGELVDTNNVASQLTYDVTREAANEPANAVLTPGSFNFPRVTPTVTITSGNTTYNGSPYSPTATVTGSNGTDSSPSLNYTVYNGTTASGTPLASVPANAGTYTVVASSAADSAYAAGTSPASTFTINPTTALPTWLSADSVGNATWGGQTLTVSGAVTVIANPGTAEPNFVLNGSAANLTISAPPNTAEIDIGGLTLAGGATAVIQNDQAALVVGTINQPTSPAFNIDTQSGLNLRDNTLIVRSANLAQISGDLASCVQLFSSSALSAIPSLTSLGCLLNTTGTAPLYTTMNGVALAATDVLVKYTYFGDADLNGKVDGSDYSRIDSGFLTQATGWSNGDFNYDNVINGSDYTLIDNAFNTQGVSLAARITSKSKSATRKSPLLHAQAIAVMTVSIMSFDQSTIDPVSSIVFSDSDELFKRAQISTQDPVLGNL